MNYKFLESNTILSKQDYSALKLINFSVLLCVIHQTFHTILPKYIAVGLSILILVFGYSGSLMFIFRHKMPRMSRYFSYMIIYFLIVGLFYGTFFNKAFLLTSIDQDLRFVMFFMAGSVFAYSHSSMKYFHQLMKILAVISIGFAIFALIVFNFSFDIIASRQQDWNLPYYLWWTSASCFAYWGYYSLFHKKERVLGFSVLFVYFFLGLLFLKRSAIINVVLIFLIFNILNRRRFINNFFIIIFLSLSTFAILNTLLPSTFDKIFSLLLDRFNEVDKFTDFDRYVESNLYFSEASIWQIIFGNGIGHYYTISDPLLRNRGLLNALHLGYANIVYKGGFLYILFYIILYYKIFQRATTRILSRYELVTLGVSLSALLSFSFEGSWTYTILPFCISAPIFYIATEHK